MYRVGEQDFKTKKTVKDRYDEILGSYELGEKISKEDAVFFESLAEQNGSTYLLKYDFICSGQSEYGGYCFFSHKGKNSYGLPVTKWISGLKDPDKKTKKSEPKKSLPSKPTGVSVQSNSSSQPKLPEAYTVCTKVQALEVDVKRHDRVVLSNGVEMTILEIIDAEHLYCVVSLSLAGEVNLTVNLTKMGLGELLKGKTLYRYETQKKDTKSFR